MATPKCPKCENTSFSLEELNIDKSEYILYGVCCKSCGTVVGTHEYFNISTLVKNLGKALKIDI